jgi:hypothetical protein
MMNKSQEPQTWRLSARGIDGLTLISDELPVQIAAGGIRKVFVTLRAPRSALQSMSETVQFEVASGDASAVIHTEEARFLGP